MHDVSARKSIMLAGQQLIIPGTREVISAREQVLAGGHPQPSISELRF